MAGGANERAWSMRRMCSRHTCQLTGQEVNEPKGEAAKDAIRERWQINSAAAAALRISPPVSHGTHGLQRRQLQFGIPARKDKGGECVPHSLALSQSDRRR